MAHTGLFTAPAPGTPPVGMSATDGRLVLGGLYGTTPQLVAGGVFTPSASNMTGTVAQAVWQLPDVTNAAGVFLSPTDLTTLTFNAAPGTGGRIDLVCVKQNNIENSDADSRVNVTVVTGTASGTPVAPATPAGAAVYLHVLISAGQTNLAAATVTNYMQTTFLGPDIAAPTLAALQTATGTAGQHATVTSDAVATNNVDYVWSGSSWTATPAGPRRVIPAAASVVVSPGTATVGPSGVVSFTLTGSGTVTINSVLQTWGLKHRIQWATTGQGASSVALRLCTGGTAHAGGSDYAATWFWNAAGTGNSGGGSSSSVPLSAIAGGTTHGETTIAYGVDGSHAAGIITDAMGAASASSVAAGTASGFANFTTASDGIQLVIGAATSGFIMIDAIS